MTNDLELLFTFAVNALTTSLQIPRYWLSMIDFLIVVYSIGNHKDAGSQLLISSFISNDPI